MHQAILNVETKLENFQLCLLNWSYNGDRIQLEISESTRWHFHEYFHIIW